MNFIEKALLNHASTVLVHCVHGQSRSCAVCIAYLMHVAIRRRDKEGNNDSTTLTTTLLHKCYDLVASARRAIAINPGFMRQLELFRKMKTYKRQKTESIPLSNAHSDFRSFRSKAEFYDNGSVTRFFKLTCIDSDHRSDAVFYRCSKCRTILFSSYNVVSNWSSVDASSLPTSEYWASSAGGRSYAFYTSGRDSHWNSYFQHMNYCLKVEPIDWMKDCMTDPIGSLKSRGELFCPICKDSQKLGYWDFSNPDPSTLIIIKLSKVISTTR